MLNVDILEIKCNTVATLQICSSRTKSMCVCGKEIEKESEEGMEAGIEIGKRFIPMQEGNSEQCSSASHQPSTCCNMGARR